MPHHPKKRFGQNFLQDRAVISAMIKAIRPKTHDNMIEIGPGLGALTRPMLEKVAQLKAIEIDKDILKVLQRLPEFTAKKLILMEADALSVDFSQYGDQQRIIGNLPYNISTPLLFHLFQFIPHIQDMHFMLQKEVVMRLAASPHTKAYGKLTIMTKAQCDIEPLFDVPPHAFKPAPKVTSAIVRLRPHAKQPSAMVLQTLGRILTQAFSARRKTLANSLKSFCTPEHWATLDIDPKARIEDLSVETCLTLAKFFSKSAILPDGANNQPSE